jgi:hypothetical protein
VEGGEASKVDRRVPVTVIDQVISYSHRSKVCVQQKSVPGELAW